MPLYKLACPSCYHQKSVILKKYRTIPCPECSMGMIRRANPPTSRVAETIDNGFMAKEVEYLPNVIEQSKQESRDHLRKLKEENPDGQYRK